jgi:methyl halide transferase
MAENNNTQIEENYWTERYKVQNTGWDLGQPSQPLKLYFDQIKDKNCRILIPGAGNGYEAEYLFSIGFKNVFVLDISALPIQNFIDKNPDFPKNQLIIGNFFEHIGEYDLIIEQTFFCSFEPTKPNRNRYASKMANLLAANGKLIGLWFDIPLVPGNSEKRPFGGTKVEYLNYLNPFFTTKSFEPCYNSNETRAGTELFGIFSKKDNR